MTPTQVGFPGARLAARLETRVRRKDKWCQEVVYLLSSLTLEQLQAEGMLALKRGYWVVESRLHHCLDISMQEDQSRVRTPRAARVLGSIRRVRAQFRQCGGGSRPHGESQNQTQHQEFPAAFPFRARRT